MSKTPNNYCLNCEKTFAEGAEYCYQCGQSKKASILSFGELWNNLWTTIFNVDNSFFTTLRLIARPDKLTRLYVAGKRKRHINPIRLFIILLIFFVAAMLSTITIFEDDNYIKKMNQDYFGSVMLERYEDVVDGSGLSDESYQITQEIKEEVFDSIVCVEANTMLNSNIVINEEVDSKFSKLTKGDLLNLTEEELYEKYEIKDYYDKVIFRQYIKISKSPAAAGEYIFTNALWGLIPSILLLCLALKLLYRNHKISYLEHLVFVANCHSFLFLVWMLVALFIKYFDFDHSSLENAFPTSFLLSMFFVFVMMNLYYKEGLFRTLIKYFVAISIYGIGSIIFLLVTTIISGIIF